MFSGVPPGADIRERGYRVIDVKAGDVEKNVTKLLDKIDAAVGSK